MTQTQYIDITLIVLALKVRSVRSLTAAFTLSAKVLYSSEDVFKSCDVNVCSNLNSSKIFESSVAAAVVAGFAETVTVVVCAAVAVVVMFVDIVTIATEVEAFVGTAVGAILPVQNSEYSI